MSLLLDLADDSGLDVRAIMETERRDAEVGTLTHPRALATAAAVRGQLPKPA